MFGLSLAEAAVILVVALIVLGPDKLPAVARGLAKVYGHLMRMRSEFSKVVEENIRPLDLDKWPEDRSPATRKSDQTGHGPMYVQDEVQDEGPHGGEAQGRSEGAPERDQRSGPQRRT